MEPITCFLFYLVIEMEALAWNFLQNTISNMADISKDIQKVCSNKNTQKESNFII